MILSRACVRSIVPGVPPAPPTAPLAIAEARCNRCGRCLRLGCPAIADSGGEALEIEASSCTGCGLCLPLCRARAIGPVRLALALG